MRRMKMWLFGGLAAAALVGCAYNEELGRSQLSFVPGEQMASLGSTAWQDVKSKQKVSTDPRYTGRLNRVAPRILQAAGEDPSQWDWAVFDTKELNAFALPGRHFGINTGIMDIMDNDAQLATVVGHEVAHVRANHSGERYSQSVGSSLALSAAQAAIGSGSQSGQLALAALGVGAQYGVLLPFSRKHELEADRLGVQYMYRAGYDPNEALRFWTKMADKGGAKPPAWMSTHPTDAQRIQQIRDIIATLPPR
ncbi:MAG: M48 family metallopeptidase [Parvularculaceae bacterium]|nr:M48 family metallopeptidase [Parvularculaceae bacterium]